MMSRLGAFLLMLLLAVGGEAYAAQSTDVTLRSYSNAFKTTFILTSNGYQYVDISDADRPQCRDGSSWGDMRTFFDTSNGICPTGYTPRITGFVSRAGGWDGTDTGNNINGVGLSRLLIMGSVGNGYQIGVCAFTWYGSGQGNSSRIWIGYTIYCDSI